MSIERDDGGIKFHELGTLQSVTRWITSHPEGLAEWLKNVRRAYQADRADVADDHRVAVLLMRDATPTLPAALAVLDVGGATLEDVTAWSTWQDFNASSRGSGLSEEQTQGNGAKAYMYKLFRGRARILGVRDSKLNCKGFEGSPGSLERGHPGFIPDAPSGRELAVPSWRSQLDLILQPFDVRWDELPRDVQHAIQNRGAFTLVEGIDPVGLYKGKISEDLIQKLLRHDQATAAVEQLRIFAFHTSRENMPNAYKKLKPRWKITYKANVNHIIGSKPVSDLAATVPGSHFVYAVVELAAFEPDYVSLGRVRPNDGPLVSAVDRFISERIKELAKQINERRRRELDDRTLDEVERENQALDRFKNQFLSSSGSGGTGQDGEGEGGRRRRRREDEHDYGEVPDSIEFGWDSAVALKIGRGVTARMSGILEPRVLDSAGRLVPRVVLEWLSSDRHVVEFRQSDQSAALKKGHAQIWCRVRGKGIESPKISIEVWSIDHVLLTPRDLTIPLGSRQHITAQVTNDEGARATNILLNWTHDAADSLIVRISPWGRVTGNRLGQTSITAGAGDEHEAGVWARIRAEVKVVPNPNEQERGGGFPKLLVTDRDEDPVTNEIRESNPDMPTIWQEVSDYQNNIWWLNLGSSEAAFYFNHRDSNPTQWRAFHAQKVVEMVVQVQMKEEFDAKGEDERPDLWNRHKAQLELFQVELMQAMWEKLQPYIESGAGLE